MSILRGSVLLLALALPSVPSAAAGQVTAGQGSRIPSRMEPRRGGSRAWASWGPRTQLGIDNITATTTPEPISMVLLGTGLVAVAASRRRKRSA